MITSRQTVDIDLSPAAGRRTVQVTACHRVCVTVVLRVCVCACVRVCVCVCVVDLEGGEAPALQLVPLCAINLKMIIKLEIFPRCLASQAEQQQDADWAVARAVAGGICGRNLGADGAVSGTDFLSHSAEYSTEKDLFTVTVLPHALAGRVECTWIAI